jgi:hypothetical protein
VVPELRFFAGWFFADIFLPLWLKFAEVVLQPVKALFPEPAVLLYKIGDLVQRFRLQSAGPPLRLAAARDQAGALQHLEVFGNGGSGHFEWRGELRDRCLARGETCKDRAASRVGECGEGGAEVIKRHLQSPIFVFNQMVNYISPRLFVKRPVEGWGLDISFVRKALASEETTIDCNVDDDDRTSNRELDFSGEAGGIDDSQEIVLNEALRVA